MVAAAQIRESWPNEADKIDAVVQSSVREIAGLRESFKNEGEQQGIEELLDEILDDICKHWPNCREA